VFYETHNSHVTVYAPVTVVQNKKKYGGGGATVIDRLTELVTN